MLFIFSMRTRVALVTCLVALCSIAGQLFAAPNDPSPEPQSDPWQPSYNRANWPAGLRDVPIERLSSGALLRLDQHGDLVEPMSSVELRRRSILPSRS